MSTTSPVRIVLFGLFGLCCHGTVTAEDSQPCHPEIDPAKAQYQIGYGSLMEKESLSRTAPRTGASLPQSSQFGIYVNKPDKSLLADERFPTQPRSASGAPVGG